MFEQKINNLIGKRMFRAIGGQKGFTLVEIVMVIVILGVIGAFTFQFVAHGVQAFKKSSARKDLYDQGRLALERMVRELRDTKEVTGSASSSITFKKAHPGQAADNIEEIKFELNGTNLERVGDPSGTPATAILASNVSSFTVAGVEGSGGGGGGTTFEQRISYDEDDSEERISSGAIDWTSSDLELGEEGGPQEVGMRWRNVTIPQGATITSAYIEFTADEVQTGTPVNLTFRGEASDNAAAFQNLAYDISGRANTLAAVGWNNVPPWSTVGDTHKSPDISPVIQEIVNRTGWVSGNALVVIVTGSGRRTADSHNSDPPNAPLLHVVYDTGGGGGRNLVMVTQNGDYASGYDSDKKTLFESWGWTVSVIRDSDGDYSGAVSSNDVMFISESVTSSEVGTQATNLDIGIVLEEVALPDEMEFSAAPHSHTDVGGTQIDIVDNSHYITSLVSTGPLTIYDANDNIYINNQAVAAGARVLAEQVGGNNTTLTAFDTGDTLDDGSGAANRRVNFMGLHASNPANWNSDMQTLVRRSLDWANGAESGDLATLEITLVDPQDSDNVVKMRTMVYLRNMP
jgi:prepilin-type N-terminal cleavage/methylation domain-containing protein